ncbi:FtsX-like permease family protein [Arachidicoccus terrestris]|uniref:FtsX-like permease family protein n=1 Tax=Arachidicoccus terrestris TaxID=2875539 RepID=UPI001CC76249|nr:FtsX-like permease family protein [Arachidicoccus terrestris]UAY55853.1 ABC transporter permease [Arachidicoccus terrestris]
MIKKYLRIALRSLKKNKSTSVINILGLAVGISASLVIFLIVRYDFSFDKWEPHRDEIYRVYTKYGEMGTNNGISLLAPRAIADKVSGVKTVAHIYDAGMLNYAKVADGPADKLIKSWGSTIFADRNYFALFPYTWLVGGPDVLSNRNTIVLAKSEVKIFFPGESYNNVTGRVITFEDSIPLTVRGVVDDLQEHSDFAYKNFISLSTFMETPLEKRQGPPSWSSVNGASQCFIRLGGVITPASVSRQIKDLYVANTGKVEEKYRQMGLLQPLADVHFNMDIDGKVSRSSLINLSVLAFLLLLLAAINFINLSTAQSTLRAKEIGVRKTFGSANRYIVYQFLTETFVLTVMATVLAIMLTPFLLHIFSGFVPEGLSITEAFSPVVVLFLVVTVIVVTFLSGLYPAFVLTRFKPIAVMRNSPVSSRKSGSAGLRQVLTVAQFVIAQVFLIVVVVIGKQIRYIMNKDLGFRKDAIVSFFIPGGTSPNGKSSKAVLYNELKRMPGIQRVSISSGTPTLNGFNTTSLSWRHEGKKAGFDNIHVRTADENYLPLFNIKLLAGRNIQVDTTRKVKEAMINETFMHNMGVTDPGKVIGSYFVAGETDSSLIVAVMKDFSTMNLHNPILPTVVFSDTRSWGYVMSILLYPGQAASWPGTIGGIGEKFSTLYPNTDFNYTFYDETLNKLYDADRRLSTLLKWATGLAIFISCLGLLGLVSFMANQRTKEIGIRKVLGASIASIISLLSRSLIKLVLLASVIAFPFAWYFSHKWLDDFAFKTSIGWLIFVLCAAGMLLIALLVLWMRTFRSASANPVLSLRDE